MNAPDAPISELHAIGDVAEATGISPETLRVWERRYGRPQAIRLASGHRRYSDQQIRWLRRVAEAISRGHQPGRLVKLSEAELDEILDGAAGEPEGDALVQQRLAWVREFRGPTLLASFVSAWDAKQPLSLLEDHIVPLLEAMGRQWADGDVEIRHEHFASEIIEDVLRRARADYPMRVDRGGILLATLPGETHRIGIQMAALLAVAAGVPTHILGVDSPIDEIAKATELTRAEAVGISVSLSTGGVETDRVLAELRTALPGDVPLLVGGAGARSPRRGPRGITLVKSLDAWRDRMRTLASN